MAASYAAAAVALGFVTAPSLRRDPPQGTAAGHKARPRGDVSCAARLPARLHESLLEPGAQFCAATATYLRSFVTWPLQGFMTDPQEEDGEGEKGETARDSGKADEDRAVAIYEQLVQQLTAGLGASGASLQALLRAATTAASETMGGGISGGGGGSRWGYTLSFDQHGGAPVPGLARSVALTAAFRGFIHLAGALPLGAAGLSREAAALVGLFLLSRAAIAESTRQWAEAPSLEDLRAPFLGIVSGHVWEEYAEDIAVREEHGVQSDAVWIWSRSNALPPPPPQHPVTNSTTIGNDVLDGAVVAQEAVLYVHGGGFVSGDFFGFRTYCYFLSQRTGLPVLFSQYRRPPEYLLAEHSVADVAEAAEMLGDRGMRTVVVADSAGGGLALLAMQRLRDTHRDKIRLAGTDDPILNNMNVPGMPAAAVLFSPWVDLSCSHETHEVNEEGDVVLAPGMLRLGRDLALTGHKSEAGPACPSVSPLFGGLSGLPPLFISATSNELLFGDSEALAEAAAAEGVEVHMDTVHGLFHVYQLLYPYLPESRHAMARVADWVTAQLSSSDILEPDSATIRNENYFVKSDETSRLLTIGPADDPRAARPSGAH